MGAVGEEGVENKRLDLKSIKRLRGCEKRKRRQGEPLIEGRKLRQGRFGEKEEKIRGYRLPPNCYIPIRELQSSP